MGFRYSTPQMSAGAVVQPATNTLEAIWLLGRCDGITGAGARA